MTIGKYSDRKNKYYKLKIQMVRALHIMHGAPTKYVNDTPWIAAKKQLEGV